MKYILPVVLFSVAAYFAISCSGRGNDKATAFNTLEQRYPDWTNLTWVSTDRDSDAFPRINITIEDDTLTIHQQNSLTEKDSGNYTMVAILGNIITFEGKETGRLTGSYKQTDSTFMIRTRALSPDEIHTYLLEKN
jgi:hypothetical protein